MALSSCIKIGKITGESTIKNHAGEIDVLSWNWGLSQSASAHSGSGGGSGSADVKDLTFTKYVDSASPALLQQCFKGSNQGETVLTVLKASGQDALAFVRITMEGTVIISSVNVGDPLPNDRYSETVSLNFSRVKFEYTLQTGINTTGATSTGEFTISQQS